MLCTHDPCGLVLRLNPRVTERPDPEERHSLTLKAVQVLAVQLPCLVAAQLAATQAGADAAPHFWWVCLGVNACCVYDQLVQLVQVDLALADRREPG